MDITNIDSDIPLHPSPITNQQQTTTISALPIEGNQALNLPTQLITCQHIIAKYHQSHIHTSQQTKDTTQPIKQQTDINLHQDDMRNQQGVSQPVESVGLEKIQRVDNQQLNQQDITIRQTGLKIEQATSNFLQIVHPQAVKAQTKEEQLINKEQSKHFFMSIKSQQSQVALLDQSSDNTVKNNEDNRLESDFPNEGQSVRIFNVKNKECHSQNHSGKSSSQESQNICVAKQGVNQFEKINPIGIEPITVQYNNKQQTITVNATTQIKETNMNDNIFTAAKTEEIVIDRTDNQSPIRTQEPPKISNQQPIKSPKLNLASCSYSLGIDKQTILYQKEQKVQDPKAKTQTKVEPLDIKTLSVLTLSSPEGIKSIRPPSPKVSGERKAKPWQKLKKAKPAQSQVKDNAPTSEVAITQSMISRTVSSSIQNTLKVEQIRDASLQKKESVTIRSAITQSESKVLAAKPSLQQLKINYPYLKSVIQPTNQNESIPTDNTRITNEQQTQLFKQQEQQLKPAQQIICEAKIETNPIQTQSTDILVHQQAKNHPLLRHYPIQYKSISKQQALAEPAQTISKQQNTQNDNKDKQLVIVKKQDNQLSELEINQLNQKLSEKKSAGSEIINDSSFQAKKSQKIIDVKKRLYQLQMQIEKQKKINQQLQVSSTFQRKLLLSLLAGLTAGSLSFFLRKDKLGSVLLAVATGVSTFLIKK